MLIIMREHVSQECIDKVVRKKQGGFEPDKDLLKQELEYRKKFIYGK